MFIEDDGIKLDAKLDMPVPAEGKHPLVIIIHGFTGYKDEPHLLGGLGGGERLAPGVLADGDVEAHDVAAYGAFLAPHLLDVGRRHMVILELGRTDKAAETRDALMCLCGIESYGGLRHRLCKRQSHHKA